MTAPTAPTALLPFIPGGAVFALSRELFRAREPVYGYTFGGYWLDIGDKEQLLAADNMLRQEQGLPAREQYELESP